MTRCERQDTQSIGEPGGAHLRSDVRGGRDAHVLARSIGIAPPQAHALRLGRRLVARVLQHGCHAEVRNVVMIGIVLQHGRCVRVLLREVHRGGLGDHLLRVVAQRGLYVARRQRAAGADHGCARVGGQRARAEQPVGERRGAGPRARHRDGRRVDSAAKGEERDRETVCLPWSIPDACVGVGGRNRVRTNEDRTQDHERNDRLQRSREQLLLVLWWRLRLGEP